MHSYCSIQVRIARIDAKEKGVKIPKLGGVVLVGYEQYGVFLGEFYGEYGACCKFDARGQAINDFVESSRSKLLELKEKNFLAACGFNLEYGFYSEDVEYYKRKHPGLYDKHISINL